MAVATLPVDYPVTMHVGVGLHRSFRWRPDGITGQDFTDWTALMLIGPRCGTALMELSTDDGGIVLDTTGLITLELSSEDAEPLPAGEHYYQLDLTDPDGIPVRFLSGRFTVVCGLERAP